MDLSKKTETEEIKEIEVKEIVLGEFKPKRKFISFITAVQGRIRLINNVAFISGKQLSGHLDDVTFKITIRDEGTIDFEEVDSNVSDKDMIKRLIDEIDAKDVTGYAEKYIAFGLNFKDKDNRLCYLEVYEEKPINKLASLLDSFDEEIKKEKEIENMHETQLSDKGMSMLDSLLNDESNDIILSGEDFDKVVEIIENPPESNEKLKEAKSNYESIMEDSFKKMNKDKIEELNARIELANREISKSKIDISNSEKKIDTQKKDLSLLEDRLEALGGSKDEANGYVFYISESQKNSDITLDEKTIEVSNKIAEVIGAKSDVLLEAISGSFNQIRIASKGDIKTTLKTIDKDVLINIKRLDGKISMVGDGEFKYVGSLTWHQLVAKMINSGFEQDEKFDEFCGSNSYESHEEEKKEEKVEELDSDNSSDAVKASSEYKAQTFQSYSEPTDLILIGSCYNESNWISDIEIDDDESSFDIYIGGVKYDSEYGYGSDGFISILTIKEFKKWKHELEDHPIAGCVFLPGFTGNIEVGAKLDNGTFTTEFDTDNYIVHQFENDYPEVFIGLPTDTEMCDMPGCKLPLMVMRDKKIDKIIK